MGIGQHFTISGVNAEQAMIDFTELNALEEPLRMKHQLMDGRYGELGANNLTKVHVPGISAINRGSGPINMYSATNSYFAIYSDTSKHGYVYNWGPFKYKNNLERLEPGNEIVMKYAFDAMPTDLKRFYVPFSSYSGDIANHAESLNTMWTAEFAVTIIEYEPTTTEETTATTGETTEPVPSIPTPGFIFITIALSLIGISVRNKRRK